MEGPTKDIFNLRQSFLACYALGPVSTKVNTTSGFIHRLPTRGALFLNLGGSASIQLLSTSFSDRIGLAFLLLLFIGLPARNSLGTAPSLFDSSPLAQG